jgi:LysR family transcriptional regulator, hydrogen peroxide-inducible genes activator
VVFESAGIETVQTLVSAGLGISLVPRMVMKASGLAYAELIHPKAWRTLYLAWRRKAKLSPGAEALKTIVVQSFEGKKIL